MDQILSRDGFAALVARGLALAPDAFDGDTERGWAPDPVTLLRVDEIVSAQLGVELPESALGPSTDIDELYRAYVLERVATDLGTTGSVPG